MKIKAKKDMYNKGKCFTKGRTYEVAHVNNIAGLMTRQTINDLGEPHTIGGWWRNFKLINK